MPVGVAPILLPPPCLAVGAPDPQWYAAWPGAAAQNRLSDDAEREAAVRAADPLGDLHLADPEGSS
jgi:hypothetical protein